jgi:hypothetical protein
VLPGTYSSLGGGFRAFAQTLAGASIRPLEHGIPNKGRCFLTLKPHEGDIWLEDSIADRYCYNKKGCSVRIGAVRDHTRRITYTNLGLRRSCTLPSETHQRIHARGLRVPSIPGQLETSRTLSSRKMSSGSLVILVFRNVKRRWARPVRSPRRMDVGHA